jgi:hypothetical protein
MSTDDFIERILMFLIGSILIGGGLHFSLHSLRNPRAVFHGLILGTFALIIGLYLFIWSFIGPPG